MSDRAASAGDEGGRETARLETATGWGALAAAILASSCCVLPLVLFLLGVSGAWIGHLTALAPWKPWFLAASVVLLAIGFTQAYRRPKPCADGEVCGTPASRRLTRVMLWVAAALVALSAGWDWIAPRLLG